MNELSEKSSRVAFEIISIPTRNSIILDQNEGGSMRTVVDISIDIRERELLTLDEEPMEIDD